MKLACISSGSEKAKIVHSQLEKQYHFVEVSECDVILALGGDGLLLHSLHQYLDSTKPIYGLNCGTVGFLMNQIKETDLISRIEAANTNIVYPLLMKAETIQGDVVEHLAFNEVSTIRYSGQSANLSLLINDVERISKIACDGILVSTPMGSTAYNFSAGGSIIPLDANVLALTPVSPFRPRRWKGALIPTDCQIELKNLDPSKRPVGVSADFHEIKDVLSIKIQEDKTHGIELLFDPDHSLEERIFSEQFSS